ncbi:hypothetical protein Gotri_004586 [Gossypium trilobum]|uniref:Uncharacterized protein n=1 Tax=Gossypium trilobum TaxID=34281 RepID=A0A7J9F5A8_9ROSI|nr:hypothetical protein [Gossypium trilobum]
MIVRCKILQGFAICHAYGGLVTRLINSWPTMEKLRFCGPFT